MTGESAVGPMTGGRPASTLLPMRRIATLVLTLAACAAVPAAAHAAGTLTVQKNIAKAGVVTAGPDIDCGLDCTTDSAFFGNDCSDSICTPKEVGVTAVPEAGWAVTGYSNCSDGGTDWCMVIMSRSARTSADASCFSSSRPSADPRRCHSERRKISGPRSR